MSLQGYAQGGQPTVKQQIAKLQNPVKGETPKQKADRIQKIIDLGGAPNKGNTAFMQNYIDSTGNKYEGAIDLKTGMETPRPRGVTESAADYTKYLSEAAAGGATITAGQKKLYPNVDTTPPKTTEQAAADTSLKNTIGTSITNVTADTEPVWKDGIVGGTIVGYKSTNEDFQKLQQAARDLKPPEQFKTATNMYGKSSAGLEAAAGYKPTDVQAAQLDRGSVRDIAAQKAEVERYKAEMMNAPSDISAQNYQAALADLNQMQGPKSWTDQGTSEQYMSPYMQNVVDIQKREANRDYAKQLQELNKQATAAGAYGGSRQAIERSEAARNQATRLGDIEAQGLEKAYQSGMGQFSAEQGLGLQAGQANLSAAQQTAQQNQAAINQQRSQYVQQALDAAKVNYGGQLTAAQQNQVAQNAAYQFNASAQNLANNNYVQQQLAAQQANQGMDFNVGQMNTANQQQTNLANQTATNQQRSQYVQNALAAAQTNYGGQLTAEQQNQVAQNAAAQYNATNAQNVNLANAGAQNTANQQLAAQQLAAQQANQQAGLTANQQGIAALQGVGQNAAGLASTGTAANQAGIANLGAQGQVVQAEQALSQQGVTNNQQTALNALGATNQINSGAVAAINAQPVQGGTTASTNTAAPAHWARGGLIRNGKVSKRGMK